MHKVSIKPQWTISDAEGQDLPVKVLELLRQVHDHGSLSGACKASGASYRHAWNLIRQGEQQIDAPLLKMERGKGSTLTPLGEKFVWAGHRITARLTPILETLASELEIEIGRVLAAGTETIRVHASHGFAIEKLLASLQKDNVSVERKYVSSQEAAASLHQGNCDLAGFHLPIGDLEARAYHHYTRWLNVRHSRIIHITTRRQGLMVAPGNPLKIYDVADLIRKDVRFVNRQNGSGTRFLLECLLSKEGIDSKRIAGFEQGEFTHAAVAAYVASGMADVGFGLETPARRFKLDFFPICSERYFLLCNDAFLAQPQLQAVLKILNDPEYKKAVNQLPGYDASRCGQIDTIPKAFPSYAAHKNF
ncbi:helix-turn-helix transcriptional regulator [Undibacterium oligocarboniphilum]|uniref:Helix-turn-helix transcriptional regulator n=2 Tax=Undibacterium oligocarboniphilum TaxID=666702 RepID=A0A850Q7V9_9BURK|nr:helix-turn-helix transcriptional regulator [Undibacterium oligocarboniphilum]NVO76322.1 helix-turn-helix transcriptional regulator [Undibacterium oligocarboniphilum]